MEPYTLLGSGMVTSVGLNAATTCAALRCGLSHVSRSRFLDAHGHRIHVCAVPLDEARAGRDRLVHLIAPALRECLAEQPALKAADVPVLLCVPSADRPGRMPGFDPGFLRAIESAVGQRFDKRSRLFAGERTVVATAIQHATQILADRPACLIAGVDSWLWEPALDGCQEAVMLRSDHQPRGRLLGEAGAAILLGPPSADTAGGDARCLGLGIGRQPAADGPLDISRASGMVEALHAALYDARLLLSDVDYRIADVADDVAARREAQLAINRIVRDIDARLALWNPLQALGDIGPAAGPCALGMALAASRRGYAPGPLALCHFHDDDGTRAAVLVSGGTRA